MNKLKVASTLLVLQLFVATMCLTGCGTSHRFLPAQPLEKSRWQLSVSWHYDFNPLQLNKSYIFPELNGYYGLSEDAVLGVGYTLPVFVNHLSLAAYSKQSADDYWIAWSHLSVFSPHDNPLVEAGAAFSTKRADVSHLASLGIGLFHIAQWGIGDYASAPRVITGPSILLNYSLRNDDVGFGYVRHHGKTSFRIKALFPIWPPTADTILNLAEGDATAIVQLPEDPYGAISFQSVRGIVLSSGDTVIVSGDYRGYPDVFWQPLVELEDWTGEELSVLWIDQRWVIADFSQIEQAVKEGEPVVVTRAPQALVDRIEGASVWSTDNSLGWAVFSRPR